MSEIKELFDANSTRSVTDILGRSTEPAKKKLQFHRFQNQPTLNVSRFWRDNFFQPLSLQEEQTKDIGKSCFFCGNTSSINQYDYVVLDSQTSQKQVFCVCPLCQLPRYLGSTTIEQKGYPSYVQELSQTEINSLFRYILLSNFLIQLSNEQIQKLNLDNEFSHWLIDSNNELKGLAAAITSNSQSIFKTINKTNATFHTYFAEFLSYLLVNDPEAYERFVQAQQGPVQESFGQEVQRQQDRRDNHFQAGVCRIDDFTGKQ